MKKLISKKILGAAFLVLGLVAAKSYAIENPWLASGAMFDNDAVYGSWGGFPEIPAGPVTYVFQINIQPGKVANRVICKFSDGVDLQVDIAAKANITDSQISILESGSNSVSKDGRSCQASIEPGTLDYTVSGDHLTISANGQTMTLNRL